MARRGFALLLTAVAVRAGVALRHASRASSEGVEQLRTYRFRDFIQEYGRKYKEGSDEYRFRESVFDAHKDEIMKFRLGPQQSWQMGVNNFMDYTQAEKSKLLGYTGSHSRKPSDGASVTLREDVRREPLPADFLVQKPKAKLFDIIRDQGSCGSCWAQAAVSTLEGQLEATAGLVDAIEARRLAAQNATQGAGQSGTQLVNLPTVPTLSGQTIVSCTANPKHCGGTGGCGGATVELAYDMIRENGGLPFAVEWPYESGSGAEPACKTDVFSRSLIQIDGYTVLPSNKLSPLKQALVATGGPVAVSVDASHWFLYWSGIYTDASRNDDGTEGEFTVNHAVTLMGYSDPKPEMEKKGFWKIKNSWGEQWGENGYIRIEMRADEENHCGWDRKTHDGIACDGDPDTAWVCGSCGILYDSVYPTGVRLK